MNEHAEARVPPPFHALLVRRAKLLLPRDERRIVRVVGSGIGKRRRRLVRAGGERAGGQKRHAERRQRQTEQRSEVFFHKGVC